jgi:hypothetical protein
MMFEGVRFDVLTETGDDSSSWDSSIFRSEKYVDIVDSTKS